VKHTDDITGADTAGQLLRGRLRLECRECEVICERVVSPWHCLRSGCRLVYVFQEGGSSYFGCLHKVFLPELALDAFVQDGAGSAGSRDPYGYLRVCRPPLPQCRVTVVQAYESLYTPAGCCNPTFFHHPAGPEKDRIRLIARVGRKPGRGSEGPLAIDSNVDSPEAENPR